MFRYTTGVNHEGKVGKRIRRVINPPYPFFEVRCANTSKSCRASGIHISIKEAVTLLPVTTARILFQPGSLAADTNQKGIAIRKLKPGIYSATITIPGYNTIVVNSIKITDGTVSRLRLQAHKEVAVAS